MPSDYDLILTGDLGFLGKSILIDACRNDKINIEIAPDAIEIITLKQEIE